LLYRPAIARGLQLMNAAVTEEAVPRATRRDWIGLAVIALPCVLYSMDLTVLNLAVPQISEDLKPTSSQLLWIVDIYGFLLAGLLIPMGTLGDRIGRRRLLMIGAGAFGVASIAAALSTSAEMLIATRALLGIAGATLAPSTLSLIRNMFHDPSQRTVAIGVWITSYSVGAAIGPVLGGIMLEYFSWGSVFLLGVPVMLVLLALGPVLLPEFRDPRAGRLDLFSAALSLAAVLSMIYGIKKIAESGLHWSYLFWIVTGLAIGFAFVVRQRRLADPMIDLRLFRSGGFSTALAVNLLTCLVAFGVFLFVAQYLQLVAGLSPFDAALWMMPWAITFIIGSNLTSLLVRRFAPLTVIAGGLALAAIGYAVMTQVSVDSPVALLIGANVISALGFAPVFTLTTDLIVGAAPPERAGAASAISETAAELGGAMGIAILGSVGTAVYRRTIGGAQLEGIPAEAAAAARDTLGGAAVAAQDISGVLGEQLLGTAREAFVLALDAVGAISAVVVIVGFALALVARKRALAR
jgi:DHA2 family multidrug resistance protein-like MFS transporter